MSELAEIDEAMAPQMVFVSSEASVMRREPEGPQSLGIFKIHYPRLSGCWRYSLGRDACQAGDA